MKELSASGVRFANRWKEQRTKKWKYAFIHGSMYWGLPVAITLFLFESHFQFDQMLLSKFFNMVLVFVIGGFLFGLNEFKRIDDVYRSVNDDEDIENGILILESGKSWNYENLHINKINGKSLLVKNELFWFEDSDISVDKLNECFNLVMSDFQRLKKNLAFNEYSNNFEVRLQIVDNSGKKSPLIDRIV